MRRVTQVPTAADSAAAPATNVPVCSLSNAKRLSPTFIGQRTPTIINLVPYEAYKYRLSVYMNPCTILLSDGIWRRSITWSSPSRRRSLRQESGRRCAGGPGRIRPGCGGPNRSLEPRWHTLAVGTSDFTRSHPNPPPMSTAIFDVDWGMGMVIVLVLLLMSLLVICCLTHYHAASGRPLSRLASSGFRFDTCGTLLVSARGQINLKGDYPCSLTTCSEGAASSTTCCSSRREPQRQSKTLPTIVRRSLRAALLRAAECD